jgi:hypothetical protein
MHSVLQLRSILDRRDDAKRNGNFEIGGRRLRSARRLSSAEERRREAEIANDTESCRRGRTNPFAARNRNRTKIRRRRIRLNGVLTRFGDALNHDRNNGARDQHWVSEGDAGNQQERQQSRGCEDESLQLCDANLHETSIPKVVLRSCLNMAQADYEHYTLNEPGMQKVSQAATVHECLINLISNKLSTERHAVNPKFASRFGRLSRLRDRWVSGVNVAKLS